MAKAMTWERMISSRSMGNDWAMIVGRLVRRVRLAEVAVEHGAEPDEVLLPQGFVQAELLEQDGPVVRRVVGSEDDDRGIAGEEVDQQEGRDRTKMMMMTSSTNRLMM